jgi:hypothetical protein
MADFKVAVAKLGAAYHYFWVELEPRTLAQGSGFFCAWSGIVFSFDWYS